MFDRGPVTVENVFLIPTVPSKRWIHTDDSTRGTFHRKLFAATERVPSDSLRRHQPTPFLS